jgi:adenylate kinase family enzyme
MKRKVYLYAIGIDEFDQHQTLSCCANDARDIADLLRRRFSGLIMNVLFSEQNASSAPTKPTVEAYLLELSQLSLSIDDLVIFYFAGHGCSSGGKDYLICQDSDRADLSTAVATDGVIAALTMSGAGTSIMIIDACRLALERSAPIFGEETAEMARRQGVIVFFGCSPGQVCQELPKLGHGVFTYALLQYLERAKLATPLEIDRQIIAYVRGVCDEHKLRRQDPYTSVSPIQKACVDIFTGRTVVLTGGDTRRCILLVGPSNVGKTTLGQHIASRLGYVHIEMSSFVWQRFQSFPNFKRSIQDFMEDIVWSGQDKDIIARDLLAAKPDLQKVVICGPRAVEEIETLRAQEWDCTTVFLHSNAQIRFSRYLNAMEQNRYRLSYEELVKKDLREYGWGIAKASALSDVNLVINEGDLEELFAKIGRIERYG